MAFSYKEDPQEHKGSSITSWEEVDLRNTIYFTGCIPYHCNELYIHFYSENKTQSQKERKLKLHLFVCLSCMSLCFRVFIRVSVSESRCLSPKENIYTVKVIAYFCHTY